MSACRRQPVLTSCLGDPRLGEGDGNSLLPILYHRSLLAGMGSSFLELPHNLADLLLGLDHAALFLPHDATPLEDVGLGNLAVTGQVWKLFCH